ncbi:MAG: hypothetical protein ACXWDL_12185, partial [Nocardioides sp.]
IISHQKQTQTNNTTNPTKAGPTMPPTKGIQTNSIDYKHTVEFSNIRRAPHLPSRAGAGAT